MRAGGSRAEAVLDRIRKNEISAERILRLGFRLRGRALPSVVIQSTRCSLPKVAARQATVRMPVLQTDPALAVASNAAL